MPSTASAPQPMVFLSHATEDDTLVTALREVLKLLNVAVWDDAHQLSPGGELTPAIQQAIGQSSHFLVLLSPAALESEWVPMETDYALRLRKERAEAGEGSHPTVIPVYLPGVSPKNPPDWISKDLLGITLDGANKQAISRALPRLRAALGQTSPDDDLPAPPIEDRPQARLILELRDPTMTGEKDQRHATAMAVLRYHSPQAGDEPAQSEPYFFEAPLQTLDAQEIAWYLERYPQWPSEEFRRRAEEVEQGLPRWGRALHNVLLPQSAKDVFLQWQMAPETIDRIFTVRVEPAVATHAPDAVREAATEAASALLALPWELLHDEENFLFQGDRPVRVRRQLPRRKPIAPLRSEPPVRVLVVSPRPEEEGVSYIDHRVSARPLLDALDELGELGEVKLLAHPTLRALEEELEAAKQRGERYHVVHFNGHGVYDRRVGLGALCFEHPDDQQKDEERRKEIVHADELAKLLRAHQVSLVFLEACQSARAECDPTASVAGALLQGGVASVVAMSHSVLVESARRFVEAFYGSLVQGATVGAAMLVGRKALFRDKSRGRAFVGRLELQDWFVPVLYQEETDPCLFAQRPSRREQEAHGALDEGRVRGLPAPPPHEFVGRSRELLKVERTLARAKYSVLLGEGGEGKTTLAVEAARWMVRTGRFQRAAFASLEKLPDAHAVLVTLAEQLAPGTVGEDDEKWLQALERELRATPTLLVIDNVESVLPPAPGSAVADLHNPELEEKLLEYCSRLTKAGNSHLLFTSREALPTPFDGHTIRLGRLSRSEAIELVGRVLEREGDYTGEAGETERDVEALVETAQYHARALVLLAGEVKRQGLRRATMDLQVIMRDLEKRFPGDRERSLIASVRLSLNRLSPEMRDRIRPLAAFPHGGSLSTMAMVLGLDPKTDAVRRVAESLIDVGLAELHLPGFLRFTPALSVTLALEFESSELGSLRAAWIRAMEFEALMLYNLQFQAPDFVAGLARWVLSEWLRALETMVLDETPQRTIAFGFHIETLSRILGDGKVADRAGEIRVAANERNGEWTGTSYMASAAELDQLLENGRMSEAVAAAQELLDRCEAAGENSYEDAAYHLANAHFRLGRALQNAGFSSRAIKYLEKAEHKFETLAAADDQRATRMAIVVRTDQADCYSDLGQYDRALELYQRSHREALVINDVRQAAVTSAQIGTVYLLRNRYDEALASYLEARSVFRRLGELRTVAKISHQIGNAHKGREDTEAAERAYQEALGFHAQLRDQGLEAGTLLELGTLYSGAGRYADATNFSKRAAEIYCALADDAGEGRASHNAAIDLLRLGQFAEARTYIERAISRKTTLSHIAELWKSYDVLSALERAEMCVEAAVAARKQAIDAYLAYRRDGGEPQTSGGDWCEATMGAIGEGASDQAIAELREIVDQPEAEEWEKALVPKLLQVLSGSRDPTLAEDPALDYHDAAELLLLLERLAEAGI